MDDLDRRLCDAAEKGNIEGVEKLIEQGADINASTLVGGPLHCAAASGKTETIKFLVKHGAKINQKNFDGETPLHLAAQNNQKEAAVTLIQLNADVDIRDDDNKTAIQKASIFKKTFWAMFKAIENSNCQNRI